MTDIVMPEKNTLKTGQGRWAKGRSGNPSGRKKGAPNKATAEVKAIAQVYTREAVETLVEIMRDEGRPAAARVAAAVHLLDRGHGKPTQAIESSTPDGVPLIPVLNVTIGE